MSRSYFSLVGAIILCAFRGTCDAAPGVPDVFSPGMISGIANNSAPAFTPDGKSVYFTRSNGSDYYIMVSNFRDEKWSPPTLAPFSGHWRDLEPAMAPDGSYLIFASSRPWPGSSDPLDGSWGNQPHPGKGGHLWLVKRTADGWSKAIPLPLSVNRSNNVFSPSIAANGNLYFMEASGEGMHFRLFMSVREKGVYQTPVELSFTAGEWGGVDPTVAPDESYLVYSSNRPPAPANQTDLFIVFRKDGLWGSPQHLPDSINTYAPAIEQRLGPDGHTLYFTSNHVVPPTFPEDGATARRHLTAMRLWNNGLGNIWKVDLTPYLLRSSQATQLSHP